MEGVMCKRKRSHLHNCKKLNSANNGKSCKLICTPEPLDENSVWLTPWFQAYDNKQRTSHTLSEFWLIKLWSNKLLFIWSHCVFSNLVCSSKNEYTLLLLHMAGVDRFGREDLLSKWLTSMAAKLVLVACRVCQMVLSAKGISSFSVGLSAVCVASVQQVIRFYK